MAAIFAAFTFCWLLIGLVFPFLGPVGLMCFLGAFVFLIAALSRSMGQRQAYGCAIQQLEAPDNSVHAIQSPHSRAPEIEIIGLVPTAGDQARRRRD
jgi:uncharacterized membrane protein YedE/YeeE